MCPSVLLSDCLSSTFTLSVVLGLFREHRTFGRRFLSALSGDTKSNNKNDDVDDDYDDDDDDKNKFFIKRKWNIKAHIQRYVKTYILL